MSRIDDPMRVRAEQASQVLENPVFQTALAELRAECVEALEQAEPNGTDLPLGVARDAHLNLVALRRIENKLRDYLGAQAIAEFNNR